jgi:hypothetical protein
LLGAGQPAAAERVVQGAAVTQLAGAQPAKALRAAPAAQQAGFGKVEQHPCPPSSLVSGAIIIGAAAGPCPADIGPKPCRSWLEIR